MKRSRNILRFIYLFSLTVLLICIINIFCVTIFKIHPRSMQTFDNYVQSVSMVKEKIYGRRGMIYDANGEVVAQDVKTYNIICYLDPNRIGNGKTVAYVNDPLYTSQVLSVILEMDQADIYYYLTRNPNLYQTELGIKGRNLSEETKDEILNYPNLHGIDFIESSKRSYPLGDYFSQYVVGFAQNDDDGKLVGKMGIEASYNEELNGTDGLHTYQRDKRGYVLTGMYEEYIPADNGNDIYLTLDSSIQQAVNTALKEVEEENNASKAWAAVVEIESGKILGWGQNPAFDPNVLDIEDYNDYGLTLAYEPGSVLKSIIYAAAMDMGVYDGTALFDSSPFCYYSNGAAPYRTYSSPSYGCINNAANKSWGTIELDYGLIYSSNVATSTLLTDYVGYEKFAEYLDAFGFFKPVDTDGLYETSGSRNYTYPSEKLSLTYGQGSSVTMMQLLQAYTAIFGNGEMVKPYFVDKIVDPDTKEVIYQGGRTVVSTPISSDTAQNMQDLLRRVVSDSKGTARFYGVDEVDIMAKTGTSELVVNSGYNSDDSITSVMLAFPYENPKYMIYFAYISPYDYQNHTYSEPIKDLIRRVALLTNVGYNPNENQLINHIDQFEMPSLINQETQVAVSAMTAKGLDVITIGSGNTVIDQYPKATAQIYTHEKVFLLTDDSHIELPDMTGWTRKEVVSYWNLSGLSFVITGGGVVKSQSIVPYTLVDGNNDIYIYLEDIRKE